MNKDQDLSKSPAKNVVSLNKYREKKIAEEKYGRGRTPLYVSHMDSRVEGSPHLNNSESEDFGMRMQRIKSSLEKINFLLNELKKTSQPNKNN